MDNQSSTSRRRLLAGLGAVGVAGAVGAGGWLSAGHEVPAASAGEPDGFPEPRFLIVFCATGGASIIDGPLALRQSESPNAATINCFPDGAVHGFADSPIRAVDGEYRHVGTIPYKFRTAQRDFVAKHRHDMLVATLTGSSVSHAVGQRRAVTGNDAWNGRTLQEVVACAYGTPYVLPNAHLVTGTGFTSPGGDGTLPPECRGEMVADPRTFPLALHGYRGTAYAPSGQVIQQARRLRDRVLAPLSPSVGRFAASPRVQHFLHARRVVQPRVEDADLISRLMLLPDTKSTRLAAHGLSSSPDAERVRARFSDYDADPLQAQAALTFLLLKHRVSTAVTLGPSFDLVVKDLERPKLANGLPPGSLLSAPVAFDFSHTGHRTTQALMWSRLYAAMDGLIDLLKGEPCGTASMWDHTLIYVATEFGRSKQRPAHAQEYRSGHDLNNGVLLLSPRIRGDRVLGGVDAATGMTYGFDLVTGRPDPNRHTSEEELYAAILQALDIDTKPAGLPDVPALRKT